MKPFNSALWPVGWAMLLAMGWLLPNHYPPWSTFHLDAWIAVVALSAATVVMLVGAERPTPASGMVLVALAMALGPGLQLGLGIVTSSGNAWLSTAYLLGFSFALATGARWETLRPHHLADSLLLAIGMAALVSVGLQLHQWFSMDYLDYWSMGAGFTRPYANMGQPNQLGTLLIWGLLAVAWGHTRRYIGAAVSVLAAMYLLGGLALTVSRTAWLGVGLLVAGGWYWRRLWVRKGTPWVLTCLAIWYFMLVWNLPSISKGLFLTLDDGNLESLVRMGSDLRPQAWALFLDAALQRPWLGYGWNQVTAAQAMVAAQHPPLNAFFYQSHNLFLDLVLWCGIPLGLALSAWLVWWLWSRFRRVRHAEDAILLLFLLVIANHAMLEFPLHYAYFLLPVGLVMGALDVRLGIRPVLQLGRLVMAVLWFSCASLLAVTIHDYFKVEASYQALRFEWANIKTAPAQGPEIVLLTQWDDFYRAVRLRPAAGMRSEDLAWLIDYASSYPNPGLFQKLAVSLALNQRPQEAALWLQRACNMSPKSQCVALRQAWVAQGQKDERIAVVPWPR